MSPNEFDTQWIDLEGTGGVVVVGQNPGRQHKGRETEVVWQGNRSGDFMMEIVDGLHNLLLTNVCNYQVMTPVRIEKGLEELASEVRWCKPRKVVCLGLFAYNHVMSLGLDIPVQVFHHPSFILRFNKGKEKYKRELRKALQS